MQQLSSTEEISRVVDVGLLHTAFGIRPLAIANLEAAFVVVLVAVLVVVDIVVGLKLSYGPVTVDNNIWRERRDV